MVFWAGQAGEGEEEEKRAAAGERGGIRPRERRDSLSILAIAAIGAICPDMIRRHFLYECSGCIACGNFVAALWVQQQAI